MAGGDMNTDLQNVWCLNDSGIWMSDVWYLGPHCKTFLMPEIFCLAPQSHMSTVELSIFFFFASHGVILHNTTTTKLKNLAPFSSLSTSSCQSRNFVRCHVISCRKPVLNWFLKHSFQSLTNRFHKSLAESFNFFSLIAAYRITTQV